MRVTQRQLQRAIAVIEATLSIEQAAKIARCHPRTIEAWHERGWLPIYHVGPRHKGIRMVLREDLAKVPERHRGWKNS